MGALNKIIKLLGNQTKTRNKKMLKWPVEPGVPPEISYKGRRGPQFLFECKI